MCLSRPLIQGLSHTTSPGCLSSRIPSSPRSPSRHGPGQGDAACRASSPGRTSPSSKNSHVRLRARVGNLVSNCYNYAIDLIEFDVNIVYRAWSWRKEADPKMPKIQETYIGIAALVEQLHRHFLDLVKLELDANRIHDINGAQALMLFNVGDAEMTVGDLTLRGCYLGSNVSYNVKKLAENGYFAQLRSAYDRRIVHVRLTEKGLRLHDRLRAMHGRHVELLQTTTAITESDLQTTAATLRRLEQFWINTPEQRVAAA